MRVLRYSADAYNDTVNGLCGNEDVGQMSAWYMFNIEGQKYLNAGDADLGAMREIMQNYDQEYLDMDNIHTYSSPRGEKRFLEAACERMKTRFGVDIDPTCEIFSLIGAREGIAKCDLSCESDNLTPLLDLILEKTNEDKFIAKGICCGDEEIFADAVILATGHSATDIYQMLNDVAIKNNINKKSVGLHLNLRFLFIVYFSFLFSH